MSVKTKQILVILAVIAVVIVLYYLIDFEVVIDTLRTADKVLLGLSILAMIAGFVLVSIRLNSILGKRVELHRVFYGDALGYMITPFLPLPTPVLRSIGVQRTTSLNASAVSPALALDYLLGMAMRVVALVFVIFLAPSAINSIWSVVGGSILVISLFAGLIWLVNHMEQTFKVLVRWLSLLPRVDEERARNIVSELQNTLESAGSTRSLLISLSYTMMIMFCMVLFHYFAWAAFPSDLTWRQMLTLSMASLVLVPPTAPFMIGVYQGVLVGTLALFRILDVNTLTAYAILVQGLQIVFWVVVGFWVLSRTKIRLRDLIQRSDNFAND